MSILNFHGHRLFHHPLRTEAARVDLGRDPVLRVLLRLSAPAMINMFFQNLYSLVDTVFVSWVDTTALAALALAVPVSYVALSLAKGVGGGTTALMSQARGQGQDDRAAALSRAALPLILLVLAPFLVLVVPGPSKAVFRALGAQGQVEAEAYRYAVWMALSFPLLGYVTVCESVFMSHGDARTPMKAMILGNVVNIVLDPLFIFGLGLGVAGASMTTLVGWLLTAAYLNRQLRRHHMVRPGIALQPGTAERWRKIGALGAIIALSMIISPLSLGVINRILAGFGPAAVGAWGIMSRTELMIVLPLFGLSSSLIPYMGYNLGRRRYDRIREGVALALKLGLTAMIAAAIALFLFAGHILVLFQLEPHVLALARTAVRCSALGLPFWVLEVVLYGVAQGLEHPKFTLGMSVFRMLGARLPLALAFAGLWGARGVFVSHPVSIVLGSLLAVLLLHRLLSRTRRETGLR